MALNLVTGHKGSSHVTAGDDGSKNAGIVGSGCYVLNVGQKMAAQIISNNQIRINDGDAMMYGRHIRINRNTYENVAIANGLQGMNRNDLIVIRYTKDSGSGIESTELVAIQGVSTASTPVDPTYNEGNILDGDTLVDMPLYRVPLTGLNVGELVPLFKQVDETISSIGAEIRTIDSEISSVAERLGGLTIVKLSKTEYDGMSSHDVNTLYIVMPD